MKRLGLAALAGSMLVSAVMPAVADSRGDAINLFAAVFSYSKICEQPKPSEEVYAGLRVMFKRKGITLFPQVDMPLVIDAVTYHVVATNTPEATAAWCDNVRSVMTQAEAAAKAGK